MQPNSQNMPPQAQEMINELQKQKQQLQQLGERKNLLKSNIRRIEDALEALDEADESKEVFRVVGPVGIKSEKGELTNKLSSQKDNMEARLESVGSKEEKVRDKAMEKQNKLQQMLSGGQEPGRSG